MVECAYTHVTIPVDDVDEAAEFYMNVFDMDEIPSVTFDTPVRWMDCGGLQLHLLGFTVDAPEYHHFALHVDDFEEFYLAAMEHDGATWEPLPGSDFEDGHPPIYYLPNGEIQSYLRDPSGNMIEVDYPDVDDIDPDVVPHLVSRHDVAEDTPPEAGIYGDYGLSP